MTRSTFPPSYLHYIAMELEIRLSVGLNPIWILFESSYTKMYWERFLLWWSISNLLEPTRYYPWSSSLYTLHNRYAELSLNCSIQDVCTKSLGVYVDENLSWSVHIDNIAKNIASGICIVKRSSRFATLEVLNHTLIIVALFDGNATNP